MALFPGDDICFPCFSGLKVGTGFDSSWNVPLPVPDYMFSKRLALESEDPSKVRHRGSMLEQKDHAKGLNNLRGGACQRCRGRHSNCVHKVQEGQSQLLYPRTSSHLELESVGLFSSTEPIRQPSEISSGRESSADVQVLLNCCWKANTPTRGNSLNTKRPNRTLTNPNTVAAAHQSRHECIHCKLVNLKVTVPGHVSAILLMLSSAMKAAHGADHANRNRWRRYGSSPASEQIVLRSHGVAAFSKTRGWEAQG